MKALKIILLILSPILGLYLFIAGPELGATAVTRALCLSLGDKALKVHIPLEEWKQLRGIKETEPLRYDPDYDRFPTYAWYELSDIKNKSDYKQTIKYNNKYYELVGVKKSGDLSQYGGGGSWWVFHKGNIIYYDNKLNKILAEASNYRTYHINTIGFLLRAGLYGSVTCKPNYFVELTKIMSRYNEKTQ